MFFNAVQELEADSLRPSLALLAKLDFTTTPKWLWTGTFGLRIDGQLYEGVGKWAHVRGLSFGGNDAASKVELGLSGVDEEIIQLARNEELSEVRGRPLLIWGQFFHPTRHTPIDDKFLIRSLIMWSLKYSAMGPSQRSVILTAESYFVGRNSAAYAFLTDTDQQARHPGDTFFDQMAKLKNKVLFWPQY